jgi:hypothetical protein
MVQQFFKVARGGTTISLENDFGMLKSIKIRGLSVQNWLQQKSRFQLV